MTIIMESVFAFCFVAICAFLPVSDATLEDQILNQLKFLTEKYLDLETKYMELDEKFEILVKENVELRHKLDVLSPTNMPKETLRQTQTAKFNRTGSSSIDNDTEAVSAIRLLEHALEQKKSSSVQVQRGNHSTHHKTRGTIQQHLPLVAFTASLTDQLSLGEHQTIEFDNVLTNVGKAYDSRHGHFIAPVNGLYLMSFTITNKYRSAADIEMVKNYQRLVHVYGDQDNYNMGTQVLFVELEQGDMVWVRHSISATESIHGHGYSTFSGILLAII